MYVTVRRACFLSGVFMVVSITTTFLLFSVTCRHFVPASNSTLSAIKKPLNNDQFIHIASKTLQWTNENNGTQTTKYNPILKDTHKNEHNLSKNVYHATTNTSQDEARLSRVISTISHCEWKSEQSGKRVKMRAACRKWEAAHITVDALISHKSYLSNILVDDKHRLLYCYVPKVACTQWKRVFMVLLQSTKYKDPLKIPANLAHYGSGIPSLARSNFSSSDIKRRLQSYRKFIIVRDPLERLVSAYRDKFLANTTEAALFRNYHGSAMLQDLGKGKPKPKGRNLPAFEEFLKYLTIKSAKDLQEHWQPIYNICHPCTISYNYIGDFDNLESDSTHILEETVEAEARPQFPEAIRSRTPDLMQSFLATVPKQLLVDLHQVFAMDFNMFGYT